MRDLQFALVREGTSDNELVDLIRMLLTRMGVPGAIGAERDYRGTTREKLEQVLGEGLAPDLIFVHRDSDSRDPAPRYAEIMTAADELNCAGRVVAVVPVQETEAWLLTDESAIRQVVGKPSGKIALGLPNIRNIETTADPKKLLAEACKTASESNGVRRKKVGQQFGQHRAALLRRLDINGPVNKLASWQRFVTDLGDAARRTGLVT